MSDLFLVVLAGHFIGDHLVQTDYQAKTKASSWWAMAEHMVGYHVTLAVLAAFAIPSLPELAALVAVSLVTHAFIDRRWPVLELLRRTGSAAWAETTWGPLVADQAMHISILALTVAAIT